MKTKKQFTHWFLVIVIGIALGLALQFVRAWTEPSAAPPNGNVGAPINTSATAQTKAGAIYSNDRVGAPYLCIGTDCRNVWPSGGTPTPDPEPVCKCDTGTLTSTYYPYPILCGSTVEIVVGTSEPTWITYLCTTDRTWVYVNSHF